MHEYCSFTVRKHGPGFLFTPFYVKKTLSFFTLLRVETKRLIQKISWKELLLRKDFITKVLHIKSKIFNPFHSTGLSVPPENFKKPLVF